MHLEQMSKADMLITRDGKLFALSYWMSQGCNYQLSNILIFIDLAELQLFIATVFERCRYENSCSPDFYFQFSKIRHLTQQDIGICRCSNLSP